MTDDRQTAPTDSGAGPDTGAYLDYLRTNRDFTAPAVNAAVAAIEVGATGRGARILDAGTGAGGALPGLIDHAARVGGSVLAIDLDERALELARTQFDATAAVELRVADLREVAATAVASGSLFDLVFSSDVVWPATFADPAAVVRELAGALAPGGTLALYTTNYYQSMFLPGHSRLERLIRTASELTWGLPDDGPNHYEALGAWMRQAGLRDVSPHAFPVAALASEPAATAYLTTIVWPEMRHAVTSHGRAAGMSDADIARSEELLDPASPSWVGADPDAFVVQPTLLWTGTV